MQKKRPAATSKQPPAKKKPAQKEKAKKKTEEDEDFDADSDPSEDSSEEDESDESEQSDSYESSSEAEEESGDEEASTTSSKSSVVSAQPPPASARQPAYGPAAKTRVERVKGLVEHRLLSILPEADQPECLKAALQEIKSLAELPTGRLQAAQTTAAMARMVEALVDSNVRALATGPERAEKAREQQAKLVTVAESFASSFEKTALPLADALEKVRSLQRGIEKVVNDQQKEAALISGLLSSF